MLVRPLCGRNVTQLGVTKAKYLIDPSSAFDSWENVGKKVWKKAKHKQQDKFSQEDWEFIKGHLWLKKWDYRRDIWILMKFL